MFRPKMPVGRSVVVENGVVGSQRRSVVSCRQSGGKWYVLAEREFYRMMGERPRYHWRHPAGQPLGRPGFTAQSCVTILGTGRRRACPVEATIDG